MDVREILKEARKALEARYGARLKDLVLFGSMARGDATPDSDIDLLVVLEGPVDLGRDTRGVIDAVYPLLQAMGIFRPLHAIAADEADWAAGRIALYRTAREQGIAA
jgi:predicted nucleotidyltransferase